MQIDWFQITGINIIEPFRVVFIKSIGEPDWECIPKLTIGDNPAGEVIQYIDFAIIRRKNSRQARVTVRTILKLGLGTPDRQPTTQRDFETYAFFVHLASSHARALFLREARGTPFENDILPADNHEEAVNKLILGSAINNN